MPQNELVLLREFIEAQEKESPSGLPPDKVFERFVASQVMREPELSQDEIDRGVVGGGNDGGIDALYVLVGGNNLEDDAELFVDDRFAASVAAGTQLELWIVQSKMEQSFAETPIDLWPVRWNAY